MIVVEIIGIAAQQTIKLTRSQLRVELFKGIGMMGVGYLSMVRGKKKLQRVGTVIDKNGIWQSIVGFKKKIKPVKETVETVVQM
jgi:hypothetical protein